jgi:hypothetical protein
LGQSFGASLTLDEAQFHSAIDLAHEMSDFSTEERTPHDIALSRLLRACGAAPMAPSFLDYAVALEAALLSGSNGELSFRFALYGALFLSPERETIDTYEKLKRIYKHRSNLIHGNVIKTAELHAIQTDAADLAKAVVLKSLRQGWPNGSALETLAVHGGATALGLPTAEFEPSQ